MNGLLSLIVFSGVLIDLLASLNWIDVDNGDEWNIVDDTLRWYNFQALQNTIKKIM